MSPDAERRAPPVFPSQQTLFSGRQLTLADLLTVDSLVGTHGPLAGYLVAEGERDALYLLFLKGKPHSAGLYRDGRFESLTLREYFSRLLKNEGSDRTFDLFSADPAVLLLISVQIQRRPLLSVTTDLASPEEVLAKVEEQGRDAVVALVDGSLRHAVFCQAGVPVRFHPAGEVTVPREDSLTEAITVFCFERSGKQAVTLEVYDDLRVSPAPDHGLPLKSYASQGGQAIRYELTLFDGADRLDTRVVQDERLVIGRGDNVDLHIDDPAASREHTAIEWKKGALVLRDLGSDNGTWINNARLHEAHVLQPNDEIRVGRMRLVFRPLPLAGRGGSDDTLHLDPSALGARIVYLGQNVPLRGGMLLIGAAGDVDVRVTGLFVRGRQARIYRNTDGRYWLEHLGGLRRTQVNGSSVHHTVLRTGDAIRIGGETMRFYDAS
ncbi:MAG: FHA domain-containing protein [Pseudomonadota bacterium]